MSRVKRVNLRKRARERDALILTLIQAKADAFRLDLFKTGHAIDTATSAIGWEIAELSPHV